MRSRRKLALEVLEDRVVPAALWSYATTVTPPQLAGPNNSAIIFTNQPHTPAQGTTNIALANVNAVASQSLPSSVIGSYTIGLDLTDTASHQSGMLAFAGTIDGHISAQSASVTDTYTGPTSQRILLGNNLYTVTENPFAPPGAPGSPTPGSISATVTVTDAIQNLQTVINAEAQAGKSAFTLDATSPTVAANILKAVNSLAAQSTPVTLTVNLASGNFTDLTAKPPAGVTLILHGNGGATTIAGHSPALTVSGGTVIVSNMTLTTSTASPTVLVTGGHLTLRHDTLQESTGHTGTAVAVTGGSVDLGTAASAGGNKLEVTGPGDFITTTASSPISALGNTFVLNGQTLNTSQLPDDFRIASRIRDGRDKAGVGLVTFVAHHVYVTAGDDLRRTVAAAAAGTTVNVQAGHHYDSYTDGNKPLTIAFQNGPTLTLAQDLPGGQTTLRVTGAPGANDIAFAAGQQAGTVRVAIAGYPAGTFAPTGRIVAHGGGNHADITVSNRIALPALLFADGTNAYLKGGSGPTLEVGGGGNFTVLQGGTGPNVLIAGPGRADLEGSHASDLLIGGATVYDQNEAALTSILKEWDSSAGYATRVAQLTGKMPGGLNGSDVLTSGSGGTVSSNGAADRLDGEGGLDLYFATLTGHNKDRVQDANSKDTVVPIAS